MIGSENYFPHFICGSCVGNLALQYGNSLEDVIKSNCCKCDLYNKGITLIGTKDNNLFLYRNIFIESTPCSESFSKYKYKILGNRGIWRDTIIECCDDIDLEIENAEL